MGSFADAGVDFVAVDWQRRAEREAQVVLPIGDGTDHIVVVTNHGPVQPDGKVGILLEAGEPFFAAVAGELRCKPLERRIALFCLGDQRFERCGVGRYGIEIADLRKRDAGLLDGRGQVGAGSIALATQDNDLLFESIGFQMGAEDILLRAAAAIAGFGDRVEVLDQAARSPCDIEGTIGVPGFVVRQPNRLGNLARQACIFGLGDPNFVTRNRGLRLAFFRERDRLGERHLVCDPARGGLQGLVVQGPENVCEGGGGERPSLRDDLVGSGNPLPGRLDFRMRARARRKKWSKGAGGIRGGGFVAAVGCGNRLLGKRRG